MSFTMSNDKPSTIGSGEGPGPSPGGIARFITLAEQSNQGPSVKTGGISGSVVINLFLLPNVFTRHNT
jgi:hypothetical protein